jgi:flagellar hook protein FlgE
VCSSDLDFSVQIPVSDSKGGKRTVQIDYLKSDVPNQWYAEIRAVPAGDVVTGTGLTNGQLKTGIVAFTADGRLDTAATTLLDPDNPVLTFGASADGAPAAGGVNWATGLGVDNQEIRIDLAGGAGSLTQYDSPSIVQAVNTNGTAFGNLTNIEVDEDGFVTAIFDNGISRQIAQVAIATFANPDGLRATNGNAFRVTQQSGSYSLKGAGTGGAGSISPQTLEASTVDLSSEFTGLIVTQRAYSASSKIITTADQMLEELLSIKR